MLLITLKILLDLKITEPSLMWLATPVLVYYFMSQWLMKVWLPASNCLLLAPQNTTQCFPQFKQHTLPRELHNKNSFQSVQSKLLVPVTSNRRHTDVLRVHADMLQFSLHDCKKTVYPSYQGHCGQITNQGDFSFTKYTFTVFIITRCIFKLKLTTVL